MFHQRGLCGVKSTNATHNSKHRALFEGGRIDHGDHSDHDYSVNDHSHVDPSSTEEALANIKKSLRGSEFSIGKHRHVQGARFSFWVDIYIEIDYGLCEKHGESCATVVGPKTLNYGEYITCCISQRDSATS